MNDQSALTFQANGAPYCQRFGDIYFDSNYGCEQSEAIFIETNKIKSRLMALPNSVTIAETGFGTGLNFLLTLKAFHEAQQSLSVIKSAAELGHLHYISVEKYPLSNAQLAKSLAIFPQLSCYSKALLAQYPSSPSTELNSNTCKLSFYSGKVTLTLHFSDVVDAFANISCPPLGLVDAWFLDGFAPSKNPDMWRKPLFDELARLSKEQATLSTFTIAGAVKRQLHAVGFRVEKVNTSGQKKQILHAIFQRNKLPGLGFHLRPHIPKPQQVAIIGGGIASACAAYALTAKGVKVTVYCKDTTLAQGASNNAIGALYPLLNQQRDEISEFYQQAFWRAKALYQEIHDAGFKFDHQWCGVLEVSYNKALQKKQQLFEKNQAWPPELIVSINKIKAQNISGLPLPFGGLFIPNAGWVCPPALVQQLFNAAAKTNRLRIETGFLVKKISQNSSKGWLLHHDKKVVKEQVLIICAGAESIKIAPIDQLPLSSVRGQVTSMASHQPINKLATVICHKGYLTPENNGIHCIGATFEQNSFVTEVSAQDDEFNLNTLNNALPGLVEWDHQDVVSAKARLRGMTPDRLPIVGAMPDIDGHINTYSHLKKDKNWKFDQAPPVLENLYVLTGLGARGLCSAPLLADILAADICGTPYPVDQKTLFNLAPNRFVIRDLIKNKR